MKTHRLFILMTLLFLSFTQLFAYEKRDMLQKMSSLQNVKEALIMDQKWVPFPAYTDRAAWSKFIGEYASAAIAQGETYLDYDWKVVPASAYLEYEKSGNRVVMENPLGANNKAISSLLLAELAEGKGRFIAKIADGAFHACEMTSWALSAHLSSAQYSHRSLPDYDDEVIELVSSEMGALLSWTHYFLHNEIDKISPQISERIRHEVRDRILTPYLNERPYWWIALPYKDGMMVNNWNPWCNFNVLQCFMLMDNNRDEAAKGVYRTMLSVDQFINYNHQDGGCEEGPSYWGHAAGKFYDYLQMLFDATGGKISLFDQSMIRNMGEYIVRSYVGNGWVVNFADASAKGGGDGPLIYRYGRAVNSDLMIGYAAFLESQTPQPQRIIRDINIGTDIFRCLQTILHKDELTQIKAEIPFAPYSWYPETQFCYMKNKGGVFLATKGGYNSESHNHNDAGTFSLYFDNTPIIIDAGVGTYTRQTFSNERYDIWTMQSNYHNLPMINGIPEKFGSEYKATNVHFDAKKKTFSADIATAYPAEAQVKKWTRSYTMLDKGVRIEDSFQLDKTLSPNKINFMTWGNVDTSKPGYVDINVDNRKMRLEYDAKAFDVVVETIHLDDKRLSNVWGEEIYRVVLTAKTMKMSDQYKYTIINVK